MQRSMQVINYVNLFLKNGQFYYRRTWLTSDEGPSYADAESFQDGLPIEI